jgi:hydroxymethylbilane synthase
MGGGASPASLRRTVSERVRVGTRRSALARAQTETVLRRLRRTAPSRVFEPVYVDTSGDRDRSLGASPDFTDTIDRALLAGEVDLAVHSAKDLPVELDPRMELWGTPPRADARDCLVFGRRPGPGELTRGARVGSSSLRRRAQLLRWRPDLEVVEVRGNVGTRVARVRSGDLDAAILAVAGLQRLARADEIGRVLPRTDFLPAPAQGALAVVGRRGERELERLVGKLNHPATLAAVRAERAFARALGGDCDVPLGCSADARGGTLGVIGEVLTPDGRTRLRGTRRGTIASAERTGADLGRSLLDRGASELLRARR